MKNRKSMSADTLYKIFIVVALITFAITIVVPVGWVFLASIKENSEFYQNPWSLPKGFHFQNFIDAFNKANMGAYMLNSVLVTAVGLAILLVVALPAAFPLPFPGPEADQRRLYGRPIYQRQLYRGAHFPDAGGR